MHTVLHTAIKTTYIKTKLKRPVRCAHLITWLLPLMHPLHVTLCFLTGRANVVNWIDYYPFIREIMYCLLFLLIIILIILIPISSSSSNKFVQSTWFAVCTCVKMYKCRYGCTYIYVHIRLIRVYGKYLFLNILDTLFF